MSIMVKQRKKNGTNTYNYEKRFMRDGERVQEMRILPAKDYVELLRSACTHKLKLEKQRKYFVYKSQPFQLETIVNIPGQPTFLRCSTANERLELPPWLRVVSDVTGDEAYSSHSISERGFHYPL